MDGGIETTVPMVERPLFLVSAERSGSTMFRLMLDHHPQICVHPEFSLAVDLLPEEEGWPDLEQYYQWLSIHRVFIASRFVIDRSLNYRQLVNSFLGQHQRRQGKPVVAAKVRRNFHRLPRIWPDARFIHLIRDGRDVSRSILGQGWAGNVYVASDVWIEAEETWTRLRDSLDDRNWFEVRYEELVSDPEARLTEICEFVGIPFDSAMLGYDETTTYDRPDTGLVQQWRHRMSGYEIQLIESRAGELLKQRGYELSGLGSLRITSLCDRCLRFDSRLRKTVSAIKMFGPLLCASSALARTMNATAWRNRLVLRKHEITNRRLK